MAKRPTRKPQTLIQKSRSVSAAAKALFNHGPERGGKKKVYRKFFGLSDTEQQAIEHFAGRRIDVNLSRSTV